MIFISILILVTIAIAASAAFFSVYGMANLFTGAMIPVIIMGASLEAGKLVAASFLYRYTDKIGKALKVYLASSVLVLMLITSMGIFGFLTAAYQTDTIPLAEMQQKIELYDAEQKQLIERRAQIDKQIADVGPNYVKAKQRLVKEFAAERTTIDARMAELTPELQKLKTDHVNVKAKVGPIMFIAEVMGKDPGTAVFWFVIILVCVFDPLAVALTVASNIAIRLHKEEKAKVFAIENKPVHMDSLKAYVDKRIEQVASTPTETPTPTATPEPTPQILLEVPTECPPGDESCIAGSNSLA